MATTETTDSVQTRLLGREFTFPVEGTWLAYWLVMFRLVGGWWLLHAGLDKLVNWPFDAGWFVGGAAQGTSLGPFVTLFSDGAALTFVNIAIPIGQTMIGLGLILGALTRTAAFFGAFLMVFFYFINGETGGWAHGVVTGELLGLLVFGMIATLGAGRVLGVDGYLIRTEFVDKHPRLRYLIG
ncbi:DoxX family membrane protein [Halovenus sp. WSH3]|uniref:DoxX family membrane protein n=1 Tax=Halovenus carboxidivorans TaxID=2692199 RepID=A0A6B0SZX3_9EURY|nr:DoxX family membrane protein [Halovenus carboxidivorans]MXR51438.1 DoxX family membrane protein [Halovenus carboxidivorans]